MLHQETNERRGLSANDRRLGIRFPIEMELTYRVGAKSVPWASGRTINISSCGILVRTDSVPVQGSKIQMALAWPKLLDDRVPLQLVVNGQVVRAGAGQVAVEVKRFEFRTAARTPMQAQRPLPRPDGPRLPDGKIW